MTDSNQILINVENLTKSYRVHKKEPGLLGSLRSLFYRRFVDKVALAGVSLSVKEGEIVGLVGANGAGKTTLVKILSGIIYPTSGDARVLGYIPSERHTAFRKQIALIMGQKAQLWWDLPAADGFLLLREIYRIPRDEFQKSLDYFVEALDVGKLLNIQIRRLSLGERMKMELIAALLHKPRVVFLDEPTIGLDITAQRAIRKFILEYRREHNPAMILTSHYMEDIESLCERIVIIREGNIIYDGPLEKVISDYAHHKVIGIRFHSSENQKSENKIHLPEHLGRIQSFSEDTLKAVVPRDRVSDAVQFLLSGRSVMDLTIEKEDIADVIESLMRNGRSSK